MKCPKCGFISYAGLPQCKKCGHQFIASKRDESKSLLSRLLSKSPAASPRPAAPSVSADPAPANRTATPTAKPIEPPERKQEPAAGAAPPKAEGSGESPSALPWQEELSERVKNFRRRRARSLAGFDPSGQLDIDFDTRDLETEPLADAEMIESPLEPGKLDANLGDSPQAQGATPVLESLSLENPTRGLRVISSAAVEAGEIPLDDQVQRPEPVEIVVESPRRAAPAVPLEATSLACPSAPLGPRFLAGMVDALVLLLAAGLFAVIFWFAGGRISFRPLNIAVLTFVAVFVFLLYFGLFTALTASTPGLLAMGLEVRTFDGALPSSGESLRRAFGYLVSLAALTLGFVWALVDSEHLSWHDRMSGTFVKDRG